MGYVYLYGSGKWIKLESEVFIYGFIKIFGAYENIPERFSNLAFWRGVRNLKDYVVNAFEYLDSWGTHIESLLPSGNYVKSSEISLTPNVEFYPDDLGFRIFTLSSQSGGVITILAILSVIGASFRINLSTEKTSILIGKHIDAIQVNYLSTNKILVSFELPTPIFKPAWFSGGYVNGCTIPQCSVLSRFMAISESDLPNYENMTLNSVTIYYH